MKSASRISTLTLCAFLAATLSSCGGGGGSSGGGGGGGNSAPVITSASAVTFAENGAGTVITVTATDANADTLVYTLEGADAGRLGINSSTGAITFVARPDFEHPADANGDNVYEVTVRVSDGAATDTAAISVTVTNRTGNVSTRRVGQGFEQPLYVLGRGDGSGRVLVVEKTGKVRVLDPRTGVIEATPFLDISSQINTSSERGLLGLALAPDFATTGRFYAYLTVTGGTIQIRKFTAASTGVAAGDNGDIILTIPHPRGNHNGGWIDFDANGNLIIAVGDGGSSGDPDRNGQNPNVLLGKMLRIDPRTDAYPGDDTRDYGIPAGNPYATSGGRPEIWHIGLRNPFRNSYDRETGNLYIADVGQALTEEIDLVRPSDGPLNFGWSILEGTGVYNGGSTAGLTAPVLEYFHGSGPLDGASLTGGYVYRGPVVSLKGQYVFGDFINNRIWSIPVSLFTPGITLTNSSVTDRTAAFAPDVGSLTSITSFGEDDAKNLYITSYGGDVFMVDEVDE